MWLDATTVIALICVAVALGICTKSSDPYGLFHLTLNKLPGEDGDPKTEWLNMGYWKDTDVFPKACEALALKLIHSSQYKTGARVLDVGHGTGESLILQLSHPDVPRASSITGITSLKAHYERSMARVARLQHQTEVQFYHGDAVFRPQSKKHPLDPRSPMAAFDAILALDCAYHFKSRDLFLRQSLARLAPDGRIALADICFTTASLEKAYLRPFIRLIMPAENVMSTEEYVQRMHDIGYRDIQLEDISNEVFPGFCKFLKEMGGLWWILGRIILLLGAKFVIVSGVNENSK